MAAKKHSTERPIILGAVERAGEAATKMTAISRRSVKSKGQVQRQSAGKKAKRTGGSMRMELPTTTAKRKATMEAMFGVDSAAIYSEQFKRSEARAIARAEGKRLKRKRSIRASLRIKAIAERLRGIQ